MRSQSCNLFLCLLNVYLYSSQAEKKYAYVNLHSTLDGQWYGIIATLDTDSDENWISQDIVDRLRLEVANGLVTKWRGFNGATVASDSTVRATWCNRGAGISYASVFRVVPNAPFDILFGRNLLASGEVSWGGCLDTRFGIGPHTKTQEQRRSQTYSLQPDSKQSADP